VASDQGVGINESTGEHGHDPFVGWVSHVAQGHQGIATEIPGLASGDVPPTVADQEIVASIGDHG
jgi:hypothetical protein